MLRSTTGRVASALHRSSRQFQRPFSISKTLLALGAGTGRRTLRPQASSFPRSLTSRTPYSTTAPDATPSPKDLSDEEALARIDQVPSMGDVFRQVPKKDLSRITSAYLLICEVMLYLARPGENAPAYLSMFTNAAVPPDSEIGRARKALFDITKLATELLSAVPDSAALKNEYAPVFGLSGALDACFLAYEGPGKHGDEDLQEWTKFWSRAQPIVLEMAVMLDGMSDKVMKGIP
ncbi:hypothetical protein MKEN_00024000 [Mycena kentingensis (nom. inval.)]|nr:hypothetical protein MKEN_00024000 [Mycena kentingensis (nom. inval.)]